MRCFERGANGEWRVVSGSEPAIRYSLFAIPYSLPATHYPLLTPRAGHARLACEVSGTVLSPAAGTRRSNSGGGALPRLSATGISGLQAGEDVNHRQLSQQHTPESRFKINLATVIRPAGGQRAAGRGGLLP